MHINQEKLAIGVLSGTSLDGIDVGLFKIKGSDTKTILKLIDFHTYPYSKSIKHSLLMNSLKESSSVEEICRLNIILGRLFGESVIKILKKNKLKSDDISFVGSHGQTIHHLPDYKLFSGYKVKSTLQIGDPSTIANITGITTVGDFRVADCAVGGDGAPLVPYFDYILFRSKSVNRALINIGGISNITVIPHNCNKNEVIAFDTGPGNMLIDGLSQKLFNKKYDRNSYFSKKGKLNKIVFDYLKKDKIYKKSPPKSTGREVYGENFQIDLISNFKYINKFDMIRTVTEFTAYTIYYNYRHFIERKISVDEIILSGGGAWNPLLVNSLIYYFKGTKITGFNSFGIDAESKESALFVVLANECLLGHSANMPNITGSKKYVVLGKICLVKK